MNKTNIIREFRIKQFVQLAGYLLWICIFIFGCAPAVKFKSPDRERFNKVVKSTALQDSLLKGKLVTGMPYFVVDDIISEGNGTRKSPVPGVGSRQILKESEGFLNTRRFRDPRIMVYLDEYRTQNGKLSIWYQFPDFFRAGVITGDTLFIFHNDFVSSSIIECLKTPASILVDNTMTGITAGDTLYAEIHHRDNPERKISYWYSVSLSRFDSRIIVLNSIDFRLYPVEQMELKGRRITSFQWED